MTKRERACGWGYIYSVNHSARARALERKDRTKEGPAHGKYASCVRVCLLMPARAVVVVVAVLCAADARSSLRTPRARSEKFPSAVACASGFPFVYGIPFYSRMKGYRYGEMRKEVGFSTVRIQFSLFLSFRLLLPRLCHLFAFFSLYHTRSSLCFSRVRSTPYSFVDGFHTRTAGDLRRLRKCLTAERVREK